MSATVDILGVDVPAYRVFIVLMCVALFLATWFVFNRTTIGMQLRAVVQDRNIASSLGINADRVFTLTFAYGARSQALRVRSSLRSRAFRPKWEPPT